MQLFCEYLICFMLLIKFGHTIDCFKCISVNGDNPSCDDPFHNNFSVEFFHSPCMGGRKNRDGLFPATSCVKLNGIHENGTTLTVRTCALDSGTLTTDTELVRMSHCGSFKWENLYLRGCVQSCNDADGCNRSTRLIATPNVFVLPCIAILSLLIYSACVIC